MVFVDMQQEFLAKPRLLAISQIDCALDKCQKVPDHSRRIGLPVAFVRLPAGDVHRAVSKKSGICAEVFETDDWIEQTLPRDLGYGKNAGG
jgi:hypothetical protein